MDIFSYTLLCVIFIHFRKYYYADVNEDGCK